MAEIFGFANVTPRNIIVHLVITYGVRTVKDLKANHDKNVKSNDWNADSDIEHSWKGAADSCKTFADGTPLALTDDTIMNLLLVPIKKSKALSDDVKAWHITDPALQTWPTFKTRTNKECNCTLLTGTAAGYHALAAATEGLQITNHSANAAVASPQTDATPPPASHHVDGGEGIPLYYCPHSRGFSPLENHTSMTWMILSKGWPLDHCHPPQHDEWSNHIPHARTYQQSQYPWYYHPQPSCSNWLMAAGAWQDNQAH